RRRRPPRRIRASRYATVCKQPASKDGGGRPRARRRSRRGESRGAAMTLGHVATGSSRLRDRLVHELDEVRHELPLVRLTPEKSHGERGALGAPGLEENLVSAIAL